MVLLVRRLPPLMSAPLPRRFHRGLKRKPMALIKKLRKAVRTPGRASRRRERGGGALSLHPAYFFPFAGVPRRPPGRHPQ